jgi:uncharacterized membrane protein YkvA (DUF1232 family)
MRAIVSEGVAQRRACEHPPPMTWLGALAATLLLYAAFVGWLLLAGRREDARALIGFIPDCIVLLRRLLREGHVPRRSRVLVWLLIGYLALPFDLVPDVIPVAGQLDDVLLVAAVLRVVLRSADPQAIIAHWPGPRASLDVLLRLVTRGAGSAR